MNNNTQIISENKLWIEEMNVEIEIDSLIRQINHPFAPRITKLTSSGLRIRTTHKNKQLTIVCPNSNAFKKTIEALTKNLKNHGGTMRGFTRGLKASSKPETTFEERRTPEYHFGAGAIW